jgi:D-Tyr-tRNAtyr deacylase
MIDNYNSFIENKKVDRLRYYAFDWDDNILHMPTFIYMDRLVEDTWQSVSVTPSDFAIVRNDSNYRIRENNAIIAFQDFRDFGTRGSDVFVEDVKKAISKNNFGPSWNKFIRCLVEGSLFAIVTARGHEYDTLRNGVKWVIDNCLTQEQKDEMYDNCVKFTLLFNGSNSHLRCKGLFSENTLIKEYLNSCKFYGVGVPMSESFKKEFNFPETLKIEDAKKLVLERFMEICHQNGKLVDAKVCIGFSDDDKKNVEHVKNFFHFKSKIYSNMKLNVYDTSNKENTNRTKFENGVVTEDMGLSISNKENSILRFNQFMSQPNTLQNATNDFSQPNYTQSQKSKVANMLYNGIKGRKKYLKRFKRVKKSKNNDNTA